MDILTRAAHIYWEWLGGFHPIFVMFLLRGAAWLLGVLILGLAVRSLQPPAGKTSLALQWAAFVAATVFAFALPLEDVHNVSETGRRWILTGALFGWLFLPYFVPKFVIRRFGLQGITTRILYAVEAFLILIQTLDFVFRS